MPYLSHHHITLFDGLFHSFSVVTHEIRQSASLLGIAVSHVNLAPRKTDKSKLSALKKLKFFNYQAIKWAKYCVKTKETLR